MEQTALSDTWTAAVPWARGWQQPAARPSRRRQARPERRLPAQAADVRREDAWDEALARLGEAQAELAELCRADPDPWAELMAEQRVHRAAQRLRELAEDPGEPGSPFQWAASGRSARTG